MYICSIISKYYHIISHSQLSLYFLIICPSFLPKSVFRSGCTALKSYCTAYSFSYNMKFFRIYLATRISPTYSYSLPFSFSSLTLAVYCDGRELQDAIFALSFSIYCSCLDSYSFIYSRVYLILFLSYLMSCPFYAYIVDIMQAPLYILWSVYFLFINDMSN